MHRFTFKRLVALMALLVCNCALIGLTLTGGANTAAGQSPKPSELLSPNLLILRVIAKTPADVQRLTSGGWDVLEMRDGDALFVMGDIDVQRKLSEQGFDVSISQALGAQAPETYFNGYRTVIEHYAHLDSVVAAHPNLATLVDYGDSWRKVQGLEGHDLKAICITRKQAGDCALNPNSSKPRFVLMAAIHARELTTSEMAWRWIDLLVDGYNADPDITALLDTNELWVIPVVNPDGRAIVEQGSSSPYLQRKNANTTLGNCSNPPNSSNQFGVDLNRNASTSNWGTTGASSGPCDLTYKGPSAASEPEEYFLQQFVASLFPDTKGPDRNDPAANNTRGLFITLHSYSNLVLLPFGDATSGGFAPNDAELRTLAFRMSYYNNYQTGTGDQVLYATTGTTDDWVYGTLGVPAFTFELGPLYGACNGFTPAYSCQDDTFWPANKGAFIYAAKSARLPYATALGPNALAPALSLTTTVAGNSVTVNAVLNDGQLGNAAGSVGRPAIQNINAAELYVDTPPWAGGTPITMSAQDGNFDTSSEIATVVLGTSGMSAGRHTLFVRGQDSNNDWGPVTAQWLFVTANGSPTPNPTTATPLPTRTGAPTPPVALPTPTPVPGTIKINFQPVSAPAYPGYLTDVGNSFGNRGNGYSYGWSSSNTNNTRDRNGGLSPDQRFDTFAFMQRNAARSWEIALPNGNYTVKIVAGDASASNSVYEISAEGVLVINSTPTSTTHWFTGTAVVAVTDGRLTIGNAPDSSNNKLCFVDISASLVKAATPMVAVSDLALQTTMAVTINEHGARLDWSLPSALVQTHNITGFLVYRSATAYRADAQLLTTTLIRVSRNAPSEEGYSFVDSTAQANAFYNYWVTAVDGNGNQTDIGPVMDSLQDRVIWVYFPVILRD